MSKASRFQVEEDADDWDYELIDGLVAEAERRRKEALQASKENSRPGSAGVCTLARKADSSSVQAPAPSDITREGMTRRSSSQARKTGSASKTSRKQHDLATRYGSLHPPQSQESTRSVGTTPLRDAPTARSSRAAPLYTTPSRQEPEREPEGFPTGIPQQARPRSHGGPASATADEEMRTPAQSRRHSVVSPVGVLGFNGAPNRQRPDPMVIPDEAPTTNSGFKGSGWATDGHKALHDEPAPTEPAQYLSQDRRTSAPGSFFCAEHEEEMEVDAGHLPPGRAEQVRATGPAEEPSSVPAAKQGSVVGDVRSPAMDATARQATASSYTPEGRTQIMPSTGSHPASSSQWRSTRDSSAADVKPAAAFPVPRFAEPQHRQPLHVAAEHSEGGNSRQGLGEAKQREVEEMRAQAGQAASEAGRQEQQLHQSEAGVPCDVQMGPAREAEGGRRTDTPAPEVQYNAEGLRNEPLHGMNQSLRQAWGGWLTGHEGMSNGSDLTASATARWLSDSVLSRGLGQSGSPLMYRLWTRCPDSLSVFLGDATKGSWEQERGHSTAGPGRGSKAGTGALQYGSGARSGADPGQDSVAATHPSKRMCKESTEPSHSHHELLAQVRDTLLKVWHHQLPPEALLKKLLGAVEQGLQEGKSRDPQGQRILCSALDVVHHLVQLLPTCCKELCSGAAAVNAEIWGGAQSREDGCCEGPAPGGSWPSAGDEWVPVHGAGRDAGGEGTEGVEGASEDRAGERVVKRGRVLLTLRGTGAGQGPRQRRQARWEGSDAGAGCQARQWWVLLSAGCSADVRWEGRASALGAIFVTVASTDPVKQRAIFEHLLTRRVVAALLGRSQPASLRLKALSMAQLLAACPTLLPHFLHTSPSPLPSLEDSVGTAAGTSGTAAADRLDNGRENVRGQAQQPAAVQRVGPAKQPKRSTLSQLASCVGDANLVLALEALRVLCQLSSLLGPWVLLTCSSSPAQPVANPGRTRGSRASDPPGNDLAAARAAECQPACHAMQEILAATEKCLGVVYKLRAEGASGQLGADLGSIKLPWAVLVLALECVAQVFASEPLPAGEVALPREQCTARADATWPDCSTDFTQLAKHALMQATQVVQCGATCGVPAASEDMKHAQALVKKLLSQCPV